MHHLRSRRRALQLTLAGLLSTLSACGERTATGTGWRTAAGSTALSQPILEGEPSQASDYPATGVILAIVDTGEVQVGGVLCTGTLIAADTVLAAAHCVSDELMTMLGGDVEVRRYFSIALDVSTFGLSTVELPAGTVEVVGAVPHPRFSADSLESFRGGLAEFHDIGLLFLAEPVTAVTPAVTMRAQDSQAIEEGAEVAIVGYGQRVADFSPWQQPDAGIKYQAFSVINEVGATEMQVGDVAPTPQKCHGDSGGPTYMAFDDGLVPALRIVGVTSHGYEDENCHRGGVDTRVDPYLRWLDTTLRESCEQGVRSVCGHGGGLATPLPPPHKPKTASGGTDKTRTSWYGCSSVGSSPCVLLVMLVAIGRSRRAVHLLFNTSV
jgi:hypothetical protein